MDPSLPFLDILPSNVLSLLVDYLKIHPTYYLITNFSLNITYKHIKHYISGRGDLIKQI